MIEMIKVSKWFAAFQALKDVDLRSGAARRSWCAARRARASRR